MKHHFADLIDRTGGVWTITPNAQRWSCHYDDVADAPDDATRLTLTRHDRNWVRVLALAQLRELTLHEPDQAQLAALAQLPQLTALRISHARPKTLAMLEGMHDLRELVLEYVSAFSDLSPVGRLPALQALHLENLRRVHDFSGLAGATALRDLTLLGTLDWNQPVDDFDFLAGLPALERLHASWFRAPKVSPVMGALRALPRLATLEMGMASLPLEEFAWVEANLPHVDGAVRPATVPTQGQDHEIGARDPRASMPLAEFYQHIDVYVGHQGKRFRSTGFEAMLLGKGERNATGTPEAVLAKCIRHRERYRALVDAHRAAR